jgi:hypothetical protein
MSNPIYFVSGLVGPSGLKMLKRDVFETTQNVGVQTGTKMVFAQMWGGGGAGGGASIPNGASGDATKIAVGGGGGAGCYHEQWIPWPTGATAQLVVGTGGAGGYTSGADGADTQIGVTGDLLVVAGGGLGGVSQTYTVGGTGTNDLPTDGTLYFRFGSSVSGGIVSKDAGLTSDDGFGHTGDFGAGHGVAFLYGVTGPQLAWYSGNGGKSTVYDSIQAEGISSNGNINLGATAGSTASSSFTAWGNSAPGPVRGYGAGGAGSFVFYNGPTGGQSLGQNGQKGLIVLTQFGNN